MVASAPIQCLDAEHRADLVRMMNLAFRFRALSKKVGVEMLLDLADAMGVDRAMVRAAHTAWLMGGTPQGEIDEDLCRSNDLAIVRQIEAWRAARLADAGDVMMEDIIRDREAAS